MHKNEELKILDGEDISNKKNYIDVLIKLIENIINYSNINKKILMCVPNEFWINIIELHNKPDMENIYICHRFRNLLKKYYKFINNDFVNISEHKNEIKRYYERDEIAFILNKNIQEYIRINKAKLLDEHILGIYRQYNPYFNIEDKDDDIKYNKYRYLSIFDYINFDYCTQDFKENFHKLEFELVFKSNILEFLNKIISKIKNIQIFGIIIDLIDINRIPEKVSEYYELLKDVYERIIKYEIQSIQDENELSKAIRIISQFISKIFLYEKNCNFLEEKISKLCDKIKILIYFDLMAFYNDVKFEKMKEYIYDLFLNKLDDKDNIIHLIEILNKDDRKIFIDKLTKKCIFTKEEFFSNKENKKIILLSELYSEGKLEFVCCELEELLIDIRNDLMERSMNKNNLEEFLKDENEVNIKKLKLIRIIAGHFDPYIQYDNLKKINADMSYKIESLNFIKNNLSVFHGIIYKEEIQKIENIINDMEIKPIAIWGTEEKKRDIDQFEKFDCLCNEVNKVKDFMLFKIIYDDIKIENQFKRFEEGIFILRKLKSEFDHFGHHDNDIENIFHKNENIFNKFKEVIGSSVEKISNDYIKQMLVYFNIKDKNNIRDLNIMLKSKKYENDIKNIKFFFGYFSPEILPLPENIELSKMKLNDLKRTLKKLRDNDIYDYQSYNNFQNIFFKIYGKKDAIDFLMSKLNNNINNIENNVILNNKGITFFKIEDIIECLNQFKAIMKLNKSELFEYIVNLGDEKINNFLNYAKIYKTIIELYGN